MEAQAHKPLLSVGPAPHQRTRYSLPRMYHALLLGLAPALVAAALTQITADYGLGVVGILALAAATGLLGEYVTQVVLRQPYQALYGHGMLMGLLVALVLPPTVPGWVVVAGVLVAVILGKQVFGGLGSYPFHPAVVGMLVLYVSWPHHVFPVGDMTLATTSPMVLYALAGGGVVLAALGHIRWEVPVAVLLGVALGTLLFQVFRPELAGPVEQILTGHVLLGAFFLAPDPSCSPGNRVPLLLYGLGTGILIMLIRVYGIWPNAVPFAIMLMNILNPLLDRLHPRPLALGGTDV